MPVILAIDAGTTGVRTIAVDHHGTPVTSSYREFTQHYPRPGWVEHDAEEIWAAVLATMADVCGRLDEPAVAIGITNQRETVVAWDRGTSRPRHRAIVWQDRRTADVCDALDADGALDLVRSRTGLVLDPYFSGTKFAWLLRDGGVRADGDLALGTVDSWLVWHLTGGAAHVTDPTNASRTMLYDIVDRRWSPELADLLGVPLTALPEVRPSSGVFGHTTAEMPCGAGIPVAGIAGDQQAALFGQASFAIGEAKNTYGTGSFVLMNVGQACPAPVEGLLTTVAWELTGPDGTPQVTYAYEGAIFITGAAVQWLRDGLGIIAEAADLEPLALQCEDTGGVYLVPAFAGLGSPWWDPYARGTVVGITRGTGRPQLARSVIDAMVHQTRDVVDAMSSASGHRIRSLKVDGGASVMGTLLQSQADQLGVPVSRPVVQETTAMGAAYLAGLAVGVWPDLDAIAACWHLDTEVQPAGDRTVLDAVHEQWHRAVARSRDWAR